jgi:hypothetical protein
VNEQGQTVRTMEHRRAGMRRSARRSRYR